ncbi:MAG: alpha/beta hydrolase [Novosphingobium sp.]|nr:alpha/beta hydrolase [Novosphingobium sp.]MCP5403858.1 alpha/beta hydrolase [Novosphingobium sp.]
MPILPALQPLFEATNSGGSASANLSVAQAREKAHAAMGSYVTGFYGPADPLVVETDFEVPVEEGRIGVRLYSQGGSGERLPCHLYFHGGGFWLGTLEHFDVLCRNLARDGRCAVVSVDYRLAPEHNFPTAAEDCYAALLWVIEHAADLRVDPSCLSVGGMSAGGNLAAVVSLMARDRDGPPIALQVLEAPVLDLSDWEPLRIPEEGLILPSGKDLYCRHYLAEPSQARLPYVSPLLADDLAGLPPALIMCAEYDPLAAEGKAFAGRLAAAGVPVEYHFWPGQFHGSQQMAMLIPDEAQAYQAKLVSAMQRAHACKRPTE